MLLCSCFEETGWLSNLEQLLWNVKRIDNISLSADVLTLGRVWELPNKKTAWFFYVINKII